MHASKALAIVPTNGCVEAGASSHIFSHKGGLLQEPEGGAQFPAFEPPWPRRAWPPAPPQPNGKPYPTTLNSSHYHRSPFTTPSHSMCQSMQYNM